MSHGTSSVSGGDAMTDTKPADTTGEMTGERILALAKEWGVAAGSAQVLCFSRALLAEMGERVEREMWAAVPKAHTYASENADVYRAGDAARDRCVKVVRRLMGVK